MILGYWGMSTPLLRVSIIVSIGSGDIFVIMLTGKISGDSVFSCDVSEDTIAFMGEILWERFSIDSLSSPSSELRISSLIEAISVSIFVFSLSY